MSNSATPTRCELGIIGCGLIANAHGLAAANSQRDIRFSACSSRNLESASQFASTFGCSNHHVDHLEMLRGAQLHGVVIATPPDSHADIIADCLNNGVKFILCEKPLTVTAAEARTVRNHATEANATVLEGFMYRHHPQISALRDIIDSGEFGAIDQIHSTVNMIDSSELEHQPLAGNWRRESQVGGVMHDFICYPIDLANLISPEPPKRVLSRAFKSPLYDTPYRVFGMIEYASGAIASIAASRKSNFSQDLIIGFEKGTIRLHTAFNPVGNTEIFIQTSRGLIGRRVQTKSVAVPDPVSERLVDLPVFTWQLEHFADLVGGLRKPIMTLRESILNAEVRDALINSAVTDSWQTVAF